MSMDRCQVCSALVDTDFDTDFYVEIGNMRHLHMTIGLCERCRDDRETALEREEAMGP
jgi:hypothetical protein